MDSSSDETAEASRANYQDPAQRRFRDLLGWAEGLGFPVERIEGSHRILTHPDIPELLNLQEVKGQAKPYQVRQLLQLIERHNLTLGEDA